MNLSRRILAALLMQSVFTFALAQAENKIELSPMSLWVEGFRGLKPKSPTSLAEFEGTWEKIGLGGLHDATDTPNHAMYLRFVKSKSDQRYHLEVSDQYGEKIALNAQGRRMPQRVRVARYLLINKIYPQDSETTDFAENTVGFTFGFKYFVNRGETIDSLDYNNHDIVTLTDCVFYPPVYFACVTHKNPDQPNDVMVSVYINRKELDRKNEIAVLLAEKVKMIPLVGDDDK